MGERPTNTGPKSAEERIVEVTNLYLDLLERALLHILYWPIDETPSDGRTDAPMDERMVEALRQPLLEMAAGGANILDPRQRRLDGLDLPGYAQTMVGGERLRNVRECVERAVFDGVPGDLLEAGVWRGGVGIYMRAILAAHDIEDRQVVLADTFEGLPVPDVDRYPADSAIDPEDVGRCAVSLEEVRRNFANYGLLDDQVEFVKGRFVDTLSTLGDRCWAVLRFDGDYYESTMDCLVNLYERLSPGGFVIIDDYALEPCRAAVHDYRRAHGIEEPIQRIDWTGVYWRRGF